MKFITSFFHNKNFKVIGGIILAIILFRVVAKRLKIMKVNKAFSTGHNSGVGTDGNPLPNIQVLAERLFGLYYNDLTEDETACINTIKLVPVTQITDFAKRYNQLCIDRKSNYHWWTLYNHIPDNLISDSEYFLEGRYNEVSKLLNYI